MISLNKKILIGAICFILIIVAIFFIKSNYKSLKLGNNIINQSADEIKKNILNIESYKANVKIEIKSNKNTNNYEAIQEYNRENNSYKQEITEPSTIKGIVFNYDGNNLKIENTRLNLSKLYNDYKYIESNELSLTSFAEDYKQSDETKEYEEGNNIILETEVKNNNIYRKNKKLYIDKGSGLPTKMEIKDISQNTVVYILYNEIEINKLKK